jgi:hypothetical protein
MAKLVTHEELCEGLRVRLQDDETREVFVVRRVMQTSAILEDASGGRISALAQELERDPTHAQ